VEPSFSGQVAPATPPAGFDRPPNGEHHPPAAHPAPDGSGIDVTAFSERFGTVVDNVERVIQGKRKAAHLAVTCLVAEGHLLIEDVPGVGKTSLAKSIANSIGGSWRRIQFTPDLLPSDVTGVSVWNRGTSNFEFRPGGVFANIVLADEINRASPKTQSALLEAMEERQVTVDSHTYPLARPFMVIATQNPIEHEGTYPLPEAQLDRFLMRIRMGYPDRTAELRILDLHGSANPLDGLQQILRVDQLVRLVEATQTVHVAPSLKGYIVDLVTATRDHPALQLGVSTRGGLALQKAARAFAASLGREYVIPDDIKLLVQPVLEHRLILTPDAQLRGTTAEGVLDEIMVSLPVPTARGR
jgi:MoxR-like ATPase